MQDPQDLQGLEPRLYDALRAAARRLMATERRDHTLQPTALVHEVFLRLAKQPCRDPSELRARAARVMRQILINHAHGRNAQRRGGGWRREPPEAVERLTVRHDRHDVDVLDLETALQELEGLDSRQHEIVQLRYFGGLSSAEVAANLGISPRTVQREWRMSQAWLRQRLSGGPEE